MKLRIKELAELLGKTPMEVEDMLKSDDVIELNLSERRAKHFEEEDDLRIFE